MVEPVRVLVAEDVPEMREGLAALLATDPGITLVGVAGNGDEAVALAEAHRPDVILMDLRMGDMDGLTAARRIVAALPRTGVIMHTAYDDPSLVADAEWAGVAGYLPKGTPGQQILDAIHRCYAERRDLPGTAAEADAMRAAPDDPSDPGTTSRFAGSN